MKLQFDISNKRHVSFMIMSMGFLMLGVQIMQNEAMQQVIGFIALGIAFISAIVLITSNVYRLRVTALCVGVTGLAFLMGYMLTTLILE